MFWSVQPDARGQEDLADPHSRIAERFEDHAQKVRALAQEHVTVIETSDPQRVYTYDPQILALGDGRLVGGYGYGGPGAGEFCKSQGWVDDRDQPLYAAVVTSDDGGQTWQVRHRYRMSHQRPFEAGGKLYVLGQRGDLRIMRSDDRGETWTDPVELTEGESWHQSATGYWKTDTHIYLVMERKDTEDRRIEGWQVANVAPVLMRAELDADLLRRESWTFASELFFMDEVEDDKLNYVGIPFQPANERERHHVSKKPPRTMSPIGWLETNVVKITDPDHIWYDPTGRTYHLLSRCNTGGVNVAAICKVVEHDDGSMTTQLEKAPSGETMLFLPWPGGQMKFYVRYDPQTRLYWMLGSQSTDSMIRVDRMHPRRFALPNQERHRMVLHFSRNLVDWNFAGLVAVGEQINAARHYASMDIDGDDLVIMSRSGNHHAKNAHDGNLTTFHRIENFRGLVY